MASDNARKALLIGNDKYEYARPLSGAVEDMLSMEKVLGKNEDNTTNFFVKPLQNKSNYQIYIEIQQFLNASRATRDGLIYFAGHGDLKDDRGYICGTNAQEGNPGVSMRWLIRQVNASPIQNIIIILDCCHAGAIISAPANEHQYAELRQGVSILAATSIRDTAGESGGRGVFTAIIEKGLLGAAMDAKGSVTAHDLHKYASESLNPFQQRPVLKISTGSIIQLRQCLTGTDNILLKQLAGETFFRSKDELISLPAEVPQERGPELDRYITLAQFERADLLDIADNKTLVKAIADGDPCGLSLIGQELWERIAPQKSNL
jgi:hypothetical protein